MLDINKIHNMDCLVGLKQLDDECVDLTVTSPPYDNLRKYNGFEWNFEETAKELSKFKVKNIPPAGCFAKDVEDPDQITLGD
jgi:site-specific DNA-methyltransferase (adenine-specific)